jgi:hypothetical protein
LLFSASYREKPAEQSAGFLLSHLQHYFAFQFRFANLALQHIKNLSSAYSLE